MTSVSVISRGAWRIAGLALSLAACASAPSGDDQGGGETATPHLVANALTPAQYFQSALTTAQLDATSAAQMAATADARETLSYAVGCALSDAQSITFSVAGTSYTFTGELGLQPGWTTGALSASDAAWISACVLARVNLTGAHVSISVRGSASALATTASEVAAWRLEEGAFWGNAFTDLGAVTGYACDGIDQSADDTRGDLPERQCAQPDGVTDSQATPCGFTYAGACTAVCSDASPYTGCAFPGDAASAHVVTTFVQDSP
ncbi:MAG TPA: hypothetical protein VFP84_05205 [Kofleriaceae bacterium]|nr:hypothetical protein [Kofleriaceae bacterium]